MAQRKCGLKDCHNDLGKGIDITVSFGKDHKVDVKVCDHCGLLLQRSQPGTFRITPTLRMKAIPAAPISSKGMK